MNAKLCVLATLVVLGAACRKEEPAPIESVESPEPVKPRKEWTPKPMNPGTGGGPIAEPVGAPSVSSAPKPAKKPTTPLPPPVFAPPWGLSDAGIVWPWGPPTPPPVFSPPAPSSQPSAAPTLGN